MRRNSGKIRKVEKVYGSTFGRFVHSTAFESFFAVLIIGNSLFMAAEVEYKSFDLEHYVSWIGPFGKEPSRPLVDLDDFFIYSEWSFGAIFVLEIILKILSERASFITNLWNLIDVVIMAIWGVDKAIAIGSLFNPTLLRVIRIMRLFKLVRLFRAVEFFDTLVLMISSIKASMWVLFWGMLLLFMIMLTFALAFNGLLIPTMQGNDPDFADLRLKLFRYFGSFSRSMVTMFEITLGNWVPVCRWLMDDVSEWYGLVFVIYKCVVGFAVVKAISGVFMRETFACAANDDDLMIRARLKAKHRFCNKMQALFEEADDSGDGNLTGLEFRNVLDDVRVKSWLQAMELSIRDPEQFFRVIDRGGDGTLSADELIGGMAMLKGSATALDTYLIKLEQQEETESLKGLIEKQLSIAEQSLQSSLARSVPPRSPRSENDGENHLHPGRQSLQVRLAPRQLERSMSNPILTSGELPPHSMD